MFTYIFAFAFTIALYNTVLYILPTNEYGRLVEIEGVSEDSDIVQEIAKSMKGHGQLAQLYGLVAIFALSLI